MQAAAARPRPTPPDDDRAPGPVAAAGGRSSAIAAGTRYGAQLLGAAGGFVTAIYTARALGPAGKGAVAFMLVVSTLGSQWATFGLHDGAPFLMRQRKIAAETLTLIYLVLTVVWGGLLGGGIALAMRAWAEPWTGFRYGAFACLLTGAIVAARMWSLLARGILLACHRAALVVVLDLAEMLLPGIAFLVAMWFGLDAFMAAALGYAVAFLVIAAACLALLGRGAVGAHRNITRETLRHVWSYGVGTQWRQLAWVLIFRLDQILVSRFLGVGGLGIYSMAATFADLLGRIPDAASWVLLPKAAAMQARDAQRFTRASVRTAVLATACAAPFYIAGLAIVAPLLLPPAFSRVWIVAAALMPAVVVSSVWRVLSAAMVARGGAVLAASALSGGVVVLVIASSSLLPVLGLYGAAVAGLAAHATAAALMATVYARSQRTEHPPVTIALTESVAR